MVLKSKLEAKDIIIMEELKGKVKFSYNAVKRLLEYLVNMFNAEYILNNRCKVKKNFLNKNIFNEYISLSINNIYSFDYEGVCSSNKYLIKDGIILDFLNNIRTQKIIGGTAGDVKVINLTNDFTLGVSDLLLIIKKKSNNEYNVNINEIDGQETIFDLRTGVISIVCYGYEGNNKNELHKYRKSIDLIDLMNKAKVCSGNKLLGNYNVPEFIIEI